MASVAIVPRLEDATGGPGGAEVAVAARVVKAVRPCLATASAEMVPEMIPEMVPEMIPEMVPERTEMTDTLKSSKAKKRKSKLTNAPKSKKPRKKRGSSRAPDTWRTTGLTFYGQNRRDDNGIGMTGVDLFKHGNAGIRYNGRRVYPAAVYQGDAAKYLYKVLEVRSDKFRKRKRIYLHVVDACNSAQRICRTNVKRYGRFLVDIHETATEAVGIDDGLLKGSFRVIGEIKPNALPTKVWKGNVVLCGCKGRCRGRDMDWRQRGTCS